MEFITDRTQADVLAGTSKGRYEYTDLNRVESAVKELQQQSEAAGNFPLGLITKIDWSLPEEFSPDTWPTESSMTRYLDNVRAICTELNVPTSTLPSSMSKLTYEGANEIERLLKLAATMLSNAKAVFSYSGEFYSGEV